MTTAQEILKMIEEVDPSDTAKLDEIDARVDCFVTYGSFIKIVFSHGSDLFYEYNNPHKGVVKYKGRKYTRSRDALKAIRPEGVLVFVKPFAGNQSRIAWAGYVVGAFTEPQGLPTEELAELHAIIQAIEYERNME